MWRLQLVAKNGYRFSYVFTHINNAKQALHDYRLYDKMDGFIWRTK